MFDFRYSIYDYFRSIADSTDILSEELYFQKELNDRVRDFLDTNKEGIRGYQNFILTKHYTAKTPELDGFDASSPEVIDDVKFYVSEYTPGFHPVKRLMEIEPTARLMHFVMMGEARIKEIVSDRSINLYHIKQTLIPTLFHATPTGDNSWDIYVDRYDSVWKFNFDTANNEIELTGIFTRKGN